MIYLLAGTMIQADFWCRENGINPRGKDLCILYDARRIRGRKWQEGDRLVRYGDWYLRKDLTEIKESLFISGMPRGEFYG